VKKALTALAALSLLLAACSSGAQEAGPVPTQTALEPAQSTAETTGSTSTGLALEPLCDSDTAKVKVDSQQGAAGTIGTVWRVRNTSDETCHSFGYPGMDFHTSAGWLDVRVIRGGSLPGIDQPPSQVMVEPGGALFFVSYWNDVDTDAGPCKQFDRVKVTLPDNFESAEIAASGCLNPDSVRVGPVLGAPPPSS
jgi:hypothetical protein